jgi:hypothetical protein
MSLSKKRTRLQLTQLLTGVLIVALTFSVTAFHYWHMEQGFALLGVAVLSISAILGFTLRTRCRVITAKGLPCRNEAYGFLFGCDKAPGHRWMKFSARLGREQENLRRDGLPDLESVSTSFAMPGHQPEMQTVLIAVGGGMGVCGFWFGLISTLAAVAAVVVGVVGLAR